MKNLYSLGELNFLCIVCLLSTKGKTSLCLVKLFLILPINRSFTGHFDYILYHSPFFLSRMHADEGVPHVVMMIISFLDSRTLEMAEQVSSVWRDFMEDLPVWKSAVESNIASIPLWMQLFQKRGW